MKLPQPKGHSTTWGQKISYWCYAIGMIVYYTIVGSYFNTYFLSKGVPLMTISIVLMVTKIWDAVNDPLFAYVFDKLKFKGKRKEKCLPWMRIAAVIMPMASIACFNMVDGMSMVGKVAWMAVTYVLWDMSYTVCDVPFFAMSTTMTTNMDERNFLFSWARVFHGAGTLLTTTVMTTMVGEVGNMPFGIAAIITCGIGFLFTLPICFFGREKYAVAEEDSNSPIKKSFTLREMLTYLKANKYLLIIYACIIVNAMTSIGAATGMMGTYYIYGSVTWTVAQTFSAKIPGAVNTFIAGVLTTMTSFVFYEYETISELDNLPQPEGALDQIWSIGLVNLLFDVIVVFVLLKSYKLKSKDAAIMAKYNSGEITREECDAQLSRKY